MENLHGNLILFMIERFEFVIVNVNVFFNIFPRQRDALVDAGTNAGHEHPIADRDRDAEESHEEPVCVEPATVDEWEHALDNIGHTEDEGSEMVVGERAAALSQAEHGRVLQRGPRRGLWW